jgi:RHS repeat-associated protein
MDKERTMTREWQIALALSLSLIGGAVQAQTTTVVTRTVGYSYNAYGEVDTETVEPNNTALKVVSTYTRAPVGGINFGVLTKKTQQWTDPTTLALRSVDVQNTTFDAKGRFAIASTDALGHVEQRSYDDATGNVKTLTDTNNLVTSQQFDGWGRKTREDRPDGTATTTAYRQCIDSCGSATSVVIVQNWFGASQTSVPSEAFADALGRNVMTRTWGFGGSAIVQEKLYDSLGYTAQVGRSRFQNASAVWTYYDRDAIGRVTQIRSPSETGNGFDLTGFTYSGRTLTHTNAKGQRRIELRNVLGKLAATTDDNAKSTQYFYEPFGNLSRTRDPLGNQIDISYDTLGRKTLLKDPDLGTWQYWVDPVGRTYQQQSAKGQLTSFEFDNLSRLVRRLEPDQDSRWVYDSAVMGVGKLAEAYTLIGGATKDYRRVNSYDSYSRLASVTTSLDWDYVTAFTFDGFGRASAQNHTRRVRGGTGGVTTSVYSSYNAQGFVDKTYRQNDGVSTLVWQALDFDASGNLLKEGLGSASGSQHTFNPYSGRLQTIASGPLNGGNISATAQNDVYQYDVLGNLTYRALLVSGTTLMQESFGYDNLNRLQQSQVNGVTGNFTYDDVGDIKTKANVGTYSYPASGASSVRPHAVSDITGTVAGLTNPHFTYDANGNLTNGLGRAYTWMASDQPSTIDKLSAGVAVQRTQFLYGADHERIRQTISPMAGASPQAATSTIYYAGAIEKEIDTAANVTIIRTSMGRIGYVEERITGTNVVASATATRNGRIFLEDHLGSTIGIMDESGAVLQRMSYDAWGRRRNVDGSDDSWAGLGTIANNQDNSGYTGHEQMDQLGLVNMNARLYDPITGRHISADPTVPDPANAQAFNRYSYVLNNALIFTDPTGLSPNPVFTTLSNPYFSFSWQWHEFEERKNDCKTEADCKKAKPPKEVRCTIAPSCDIVDPYGNPVGNPGKATKDGIWAGWPQNAPFWKMGEAYAGVGAVVVGKLTDDEALVNAGLEGLSESKGDTTELLITLVTMGRGNAAKSAIPAIKAGAAGGETAGKSFPQAIRDAAKGENPLSICVYCRRAGVATQVDHAIPKARGGNATLENSQLACPHCNASKGARDFPVNPPPGYRGEWPPSHW